MFNFLKHTTKIENGPLLSIVIPSYNHEKYIAEAIKSVIKQTYQNWELIIIDDGSKDKSIEIIKSINDSRIQLVVQENQGAHNAINKGLEISKGEYIAILNSDDKFYSDRFEKMIAYMEKNPEVELTCSYIQVIDENDKKLGIKEAWKNMEPWTLEHPELSLTGTNDFATNLIISNFTSTTSNFLFRKSVYEKIGGMRNLRFVHDWDFALRAAKITECRVIEEPLLFYRIHSTNTISSNRKWMLFEIIWIWAVHLGDFYAKKMSNEDRQFNIVNLIESLNMQGNDKICWIIKIFIEGEKAKGVKNPEEILLDNEELRNCLLKYVVE